MNRTEKLKTTLQTKKNFVYMDYLDNKQKYSDYLELIKEGLNISGQGYKAQVGIIGLKKFYGVEITRDFLKDLLNNDSIKEIKNEIDKLKNEKLFIKDTMTEIKIRDLILVLKSKIKPLKDAQTQKISDFLKNYGFKTIPVYKTEFIEVLDKKRIDFDIITRENPFKEKSKYPKKNINLVCFPNFENRHGEKYFNSSYKIIVGKNYKEHTLITKRIIVPKDDERVLKFKHKRLNGNIKPNPKIKNDWIKRHFPTKTDDFGQKLKPKAHKEVLKSLGKYEEYLSLNGLNDEEINLLKEIKNQ